VKIGKPEGDQIILVGQHRPEKPDFASTVERYVPRSVFCPCGEILRTFEQAHEHYAGGHYDLPIYASLRELIQAGWEPQK
jgi:hypothetical protein